MLAEVGAMPAIGEHVLLMYGVSPQQQVGRGCVLKQGFWMESSGDTRHAA